MRLMIACTSMSAAPIGMASFMNTGVGAFQAVPVVSKSFSDGIAWAIPNQISATSTIMMMMSETMSARNLARSGSMP